MLTSIPSYDNKSKIIFVLFIIIAHIKAVILIIQEKLQKFLVDFKLHLKKGLI